MTTVNEKARTILNNTINKIAFTGQLRTSIHVYNIACAIDNTNPKSKVEQALTALFDIVDGKNLKSENVKTAKQYLKKCTV